MPKRPRGKARVIPELNFRKADVRSLSRAIQDMAKITKKSLPQVTLKAAVWYCQSAAKATPISPKLRTVERVTVKTVPAQKRWMVRKGYWTHNVVKYNKKSEKVLIPTADKNDPRRNIKMRGAARNTWYGCIRKLNKAARMEKGASQAVGEGASEARKYQRSGIAVVEVANKIDYIVKLDRGSPTNLPYNISAKAASATTNRLNGELKKLWGQNAKRFNKK
jgi:hypothetical protein